MKLLRYAFLVIAALGALTFSVEASGVDSSDTERDAIIQELEAKSPFLLAEFKKAHPLFSIDKLKVLQSLVARVERKKAETEAFLLAHSELKELLDKMNAASYESKDKEKVKFNNWFLFLRHDSDPARSVNDRLEQIKKHCEQLNLFTKQEFDQLSPEDFFIFKDTRLDAIKVAFVDLFGTQEFINQRERFSRDDEAGKKARQPSGKRVSKKDAARKTQAQKEDKKESKSIVPQVVRNNPLYFGLGSGAAVLALLVAKIKADYDKNPPVDESGEVIPFGKHVLSELASFDYTKMNFWLKAMALGLVGSGIYGKWVNAQAV